jgi:hypothetical protein
MTSKKRSVQMSNDAVINHLAKITGVSRKQVIAALEKLKTFPEVRRELDRMNKQYDKEG